MEKESGSSPSKLDPLDENQNECQQSQEIKEETDSFSISEEKLPQQKEVQ